MQMIFFMGIGLLCIFILHHAGEDVNSSCNKENVRQVKDFTALNRLIDEDVSREEIV